MKRIAISILCALTLVSCEKDNFTVSPEFKAYTFLSSSSFFGQIDPSLPTAEEYFDEQIKQLDGVSFFAQVFGGEDSQSEEYAYQQADAKAAEYAPELKEKAMEKYNEIINTIKKTDIGGGNIKCKFAYSFERPGKTIDSFEKEITYDGGNRTKSSAVEVDLFGSGYTALERIKITSFDSECTVTCAGDVKLCLPDNTYADESTYGKIITVNEIESVEYGDEEYHMATVSIVVDENHMANVKSKAGDWHALVPVTVSMGDIQDDYIIYIPIIIKKY